MIILHFDFLATIDAQSHKAQTKQKGGRYSHLKMSKFTMKWLAIWTLLTLSDTASGCHTFLNRCISVKTSLINTKLGNLVNLGILFLTMWITSRESHNLQTRT